MKSEVLVLLVLIVFLVGCATEQATDTSTTKKTETKSEEKPIEKETEPTIVEKLKSTTKEPSELSLELSDLPEGYTIKERTPRLKSDVDKKALDLGWEKGYYIRFARIGEGGDILDIFDATVIEQSTSIYPIENIKKVLDVLPRESNENITYEELPNPDLGVESKAYRITTTDEFSGEDRYYTIEFIKKNVYEMFVMSGSATDYELLKEIVKKAIKKI